MRWTRMMVMIPAAASAFSVFGVASASAEPPEFQTQNKKTGEFEALKKKVALTEASSSVELRSASSDLVCTESTGKGKLTGPKTFTSKTTYTGCQDMGTGVTCQSGKKAGVIKTATIEGSLVEASAGLGLPSVAAASSPPRDLQLHLRHIEIHRHRPRAGHHHSSRRPDERIRSHVFRRRRTGTGLRYPGTAADRRHRPVRPPVRAGRFRAGRAGGDGGRRQEKGLQGARDAPEVS